VIQDFENKASNPCSCTWIFVLSNEHGCAEPDAAPYKDEIFEIASSPLFIAGTLMILLHYLGGRHEFCRYRVCKASETRVCLVFPS
jgi:hypothetical protein